MVAFKRWFLEDPSDTNPATRTYVFRPSPNKMSSPFPKRALTAATTTGLRGQPLIWEGQAGATSWSFGGAILDAAQYEALRSWVLDRKGGVVYVHDHFGRRIEVVLEGFDPQPPERMKNGKYWYHTYTITALVLKVGKPKTSEVPA